MIINFYGIASGGDEIVRIIDFSVSLLHPSNSHFLADVRCIRAIKLLRVVLVVHNET
jgi:hypothetical protein